MGYLELAKQALAEEKPRQRHGAAVGAVASVESPAQEALFAGRITAWANDNPERWGKVLATLKRQWDLSQGVDSPRDVLVRWASAHQRMVKAKHEIHRLTMNGRHLTPKELIVKKSREADVSFFGRLCKALDRRIIPALALDTEAQRRLEGFKC